ncbi:unnamed protein product, partial [Polarella glacialis]
DGVSAWEILVGSYQAFGNGLQLQCISYKFIIASVSVCCHLLGHMFLSYALCSLEYKVTASVHGTL